MKRFYLSFAEPRRFLGACVVMADTFVSAVLKAQRLGIAPGGQVAGAEVPADDEAILGLPLDTLLDAATLRDHGLKSYREWEQDEAAGPN